MIIDASSSIEDFKKGIESELMNQTDLGERLKPKVIHISAPHAEYVEFGTIGGGTPSNNMKLVAVKRIDRKGVEKTEMVQMSVFQERLYDWARTLVYSGRMNAPIDAVSDYDIWRFAKGVSISISQTGLRPQPFIRSVLYNESIYERAIGIIVDGGSLQDVAELYAELIRTNALAMNIGNKVGVLADEPHISDSISVRDYTSDMDKDELIELDRTKYDDDIERSIRRF